MPGVIRPRLVERCLGAPCLVGGCLVQRWRPCQSAPWAVGVPTGTIGELAGADALCGDMPAWAEVTDAPSAPAPINAAASNAAVMTFIVNLSGLACLGPGSLVRTSVMVVGVG